VSRDEFEEVGVVQAGKRLAVDWSPWMDDWFVSASPRNSNSHAEGPWDHWVDLALAILADPLTKIVRPEAHIENPDLKGFYDEANRYLTVEELAQRFPEAGDPGA
jgi:hypothetical protein